MLSINDMLRKQYLANWLVAGSIVSISTILSLKYDGLRIMHTIDACTLVGMVICVSDEHPAVVVDSLYSFDVDCPSMNGKVLLLDCYSRSTLSGFPIGMDSSFTLKVVVSGSIYPSFDLKRQYLRVNDIRLTHFVRNPGK